MSFFSCGGCRVCLTAWMTAGVAIVAVVAGVIAYCEWDEKRVLQRGLTAEPDWTRERQK